MGCFYHEGRESVATCPQCGKYLCRDCANLTVEGICYECAMANNDKVKKSFLFDTIWAVILIVGLIVGISLVGSTNEDTMTIGFILLFITGIIPGWKTITRIADAILGPRVYVGSVLIGVIVLKFCFAMMLSAVMPFWYIIKFFINLSKFLKVKKNMEAIQHHWNQINA